MGNANNLIPTTTNNKKTDTQNQLSLFKVNFYNSNKNITNYNLVNLSYNNSLNTNNNKNKKNDIYSNDLKNFANSFTHSSIKIKDSIQMTMNKDNISSHSTVHNQFIHNDEEKVKKKSYSHKKLIYSSKKGKSLFQNTFKTITSYFNQSVNKSTKNIHKTHYIKKYQTNKKSKKKLDVNKIFIPNENNDDRNNEKNNKLRYDALQTANVNQSSQLTLLNNSMNKNYFTSLQIENNKYKHKSEKLLNIITQLDDANDNDIVENLNINEDIDLYHSEILIKKKYELFNNFSDRTSYLYNTPQNFTKVITKDDKLNIKKSDSNKLYIKFYGKKIENKKIGTSKIILNDSIIFYGNYNNNNKLEGPFLITKMNEENKLEGFIEKDGNFSQYIILTKNDLRIKQKEIKNSVKSTKDEIFIDEKENDLEEQNENNKIIENTLDNKTEEFEPKIDSQNLNNSNDIIYDHIIYDINEKNIDITTKEYSDIISIIINYAKLSKNFLLQKNEYSNKNHISILKIESEISNNKFNGISIISYKNNSFYSGEIKNNLLHGIGCFRWSDGTQYLGEFQKGKLTGYGIIYYFDMRIYYGQVLDGVPHGLGEFLWPDNKKYIGYYKKGEKNGIGMYTIRNNNEKLIYFGFWKNGKQDGYGIVLKNKKIIYTLYKEGKIIKEYNKNVFIKTILSKKNCGKYVKIFLYDPNQLKKLAKFSFVD